MQNINRRGRPKMEQGIAKNLMIHVRVSANEVKMIESHCKQNDLSVSDMLRSSVYKTLCEVK